MEQWHLKPPAVFTQEALPQNKTAWSHSLRSEYSNKTDQWTLKFQNCTQLDEYLNLDIVRRISGRLWRKKNVFQRLTYVQRDYFILHSASQVTDLWRFCGYPVVFIFFNRFLRFKTKCTELLSNFNKTSFSYWEWIRMNFGHDLVGVATSLHRLGTRHCGILKLLPGPHGHSLASTYSSWLVSH